MKTEITDACGVTMAGPDEPAVAVAKARDVDGVAVEVARVGPRTAVEEARSQAYLKYCNDVRASNRVPMGFEEWGLKRSEEISQLGRMRAGSVGDVAQRQAGILPTGGITVSNEMVYRAQSEAVKHENPLGASCVRAMLEAALRG